MLYETLLALLGHSGGAVKNTGDGLKVQSDLPFLHSGDEEQLNYLCRLGTHYSTISNFIKKHGNFLSQINPNDKQPQGLHGLYLKALCSGLDRALEGYRAKILEIEKDVMKDPHISVSHLVCQLQQYQLLFPALVAVTEQITSHEAHGCYILDIVYRHSETGHPLVKEVLTRVLHICHGVMYKHLCSWLLYGYTYDPYKEFFIQPSKGEAPDQTAQSQQEDDDDDLGIMGVTGRQLQKLLRVNVLDSSLQTSHLFMVKSDMLPGYIPVRVANKILFVGESIQMFQDPGKSPTRKKGSILQGKEEEFARGLHKLAKETVFNSMDFEALIDTIRTHAAEQLWQMLVQDANLISHLGIIKDFYLLGRGELFLAFIDQAHHILQATAAATTEHDVNAAFLQAANSVLFHDETLLQRFRLTIDQPHKTVKRDSTSSSGSGQSTGIEPALNSISLNYTVEWPLHIFFTPNVLEKYNRTFRFLLIVRRTQLDLQQCWSIQKGMKGRPADKAEAMKWQLRTHMSFLIDNLQYYLQVDVIESQYGILIDKINNTRDYEAVKLAQDQFLSSLLAQSFVHMKSVAYCLYEILSQCSAFSQLVNRCDTPMSELDTSQLETIAKNFQRQSNLLFKMLSSVRSNSSSPHLAQLLLRLDFNKYFSISGGQFGRLVSAYCTGLSRMSPQADALLQVYPFTKQ